MVKRIKKTTHNWVVVVCVMVAPARIELATHGASIRCSTDWATGPLVAGEGFEPTTFGLWARRATRLLHPAICNFYCYTIISHLLNKSSKIYGGGGEIRTPARSHVCWFSRPVPSATWVLLHKEILFYLVDPVGLEPTTNRLWAGSSNQLS